MMSDEREYKIPFAQRRTVQIVIVFAGVLAKATLPPIKRSRINAVSVALAVVDDFMKWNNPSGGCFVIKRM